MLVLCLFIVPLLALRADTIQILSTDTAATFGSNLNVALLLAQVVTASF